MPVHKLKQFLDSNNVPYERVDHAESITAPETAQATHIKGKEMAKTVMVKLDGKMAMAVVPANFHVDLDRLRDVAGASEAELAGEDEFSSLFPNCEVGAMPPFGNLYDMEVYLQEDMDEDHEIAFNSGSHHEIIKMLFKDYKNLVKPMPGDFSA